MFHANFISTTKEGTEGINISHSSEKRTFDMFSKETQDEYKISFHWSQLMFDCDVKYDIDHDKKEINIVYGQNLDIWNIAMVQEIELKLNARKKARN